jgi:hypothetical protein
MGMGTHSYGNGHSCPLTWLYICTRSANARHPAVRCQTRRRKPQRRTRTEYIFVLMDIHIYIYTSIHIYINIYIYIYICGCGNHPHHHHHTTCGNFRTSDAIMAMQGVANVVREVCRTPSTEGGVSRPARIHKLGKATDVKTRCGYCKDVQCFKFGRFSEGHHTHKQRQQNA